MMFTRIAVGIVLMLAAVAWAQDVPESLENLFGSASKTSTFSIDDPFALINASSFVVMDAESGRVLAERNSKELHFPASTTKIMTGLLLLEHTQPNDVVTAPADINLVRGSSLHLKPGEKLTAHDLLVGIMLRSANDACETIAEHICGNVSDFVDLMNKRASQIGCENTHFDNPHGLNNLLHTTTAFDLALIAREAMKLPNFRKIVGVQKLIITRQKENKDTIIKSRNKYLAKDYSADGIKTGWTVPSGHCYVGSATRKGFRVITVVLNSDQWQIDHGQLLDWAFSNFDQYYLSYADQKVMQMPVAGGVSESVPAKAKVTTKVLLRNDEVNQAAWQRAPRPLAAAPIRSGNEVGLGILAVGNEMILELPLFAMEDVIVTNAGKSSSSMSKVPFIGVGAACFCLTIVFMRLRGSKS